MRLTKQIKDRCREDAGCLVWTGYCTRGRPILDLKGKKLSVRRVLYAERNGDIPPGFDVTCTCDTPACVKHLGLMTKSEIAQRVAERGIYRIVSHRAKQAAAKQAASKLSREQVDDIRHGAGSLRVMADRYGISKGYAAAIRTGKQWRDLETNPFAGLFTGLLSANDASQRRAA